MGRNSAASAYRLELFGPFRLFAPDGQRIEIISEKGMALIALLAMAKNGERSRVWLQSILWGSRAKAQAQGSMRRELFDLRKALSTTEPKFLESDNSKIWINLDHVHVDARGAEDAADIGGLVRAEFLEGFDLPGEEAFEDWLREQRTVLNMPNEVIASVPNEAPPLASNETQELRVALAVLPLENVTGDAAFDYVADGISEDLIDRVSCFQWLPVIARSSSFSFRGKGESITAIGAALDARYIFDGRLRKIADTLSLSVSLSDVSSGLEIWSKRLNLSIPIDQNSLEEIGAEVVTALFSRIAFSEQSRAQSKAVETLNVNDLIWRGRWHAYRYTREDAAKAQSYFTQALEIDPNSVEAQIQLMIVTAESRWIERADEDKILAVRAMAQRVIAISPEDSRGYLYLGICEIGLQHLGLAISLFKQALSYNASLADAHAHLGTALYLSGQAQDAIAPLESALRLDPSGTRTYFTYGELSIAHLMDGNFQKAIDYADRALILRRGYWYAHVSKINALVRLGDKDAAKASLFELQQSKNKFSPDYIDWLQFESEGARQFLHDGLEKAGWQ